VLSSSVNSIKQIEAAREQFAVQERLLTLAQLARLAAGDIDYRFDPIGMVILSFNGEDWARREMIFSRLSHETGIRLRCNFTVEARCLSAKKLKAYVQPVLHPWPVSMENSTNVELVLSSSISGFARSKNSIDVEPVVRAILVKYILLTKLLAENQWPTPILNDASGSLFDMPTSTSA